jgi:putative peptidoglycan lipid II flippase
VNSVTNHRIKIANSAVTLALISVLGPAAGLAVEIVLAWRYGTSPTLDGFRVAMLLITFGQQMLLATILPNVVIPLFTGHSARGRASEGWTAVFTLGAVLLVPIMLLSGAAAAGPERVADFLAPGLTPEAKIHAAFFVRWFALAYVPMVWTGISAALLNAEGVFWLPALGQLINNSVVIAAIVSVGRTPRAYELAAGVLGGVVVTAVVQSLYVRRLMTARGVRLRRPNRSSINETAQSMALVIPLLFAMLASQATAVVVNRALSSLPPGTIASFGYAWKMLVFVQLVPLSIATVLFPRLSTAAQETEREEFGAIAIRALRMGLLAAVPLTCAFFAFRSELITVLFKRGHFTDSDVAATASLFGIVVLATPAYVLIVNLHKCFYSAKNTVVPSCTLLLGSAFLVAVGPYAARHGARVVAAATVASTLLIAVALLCSFRVYFKKGALVGLGGFIVQICALAAVCTAVGIQVRTMIGVVSAHSPASVNTAAATGFVASLGLFAAGVTLLGIPEGHNVREYTRWMYGHVPQRYRRLLLHDASRSD